MPRLQPRGASCVYTVVLCVGICPIIHSMTFYGVSARSDVCLYTSPTKNALERK